MKSCDRCGPGQKYDLESETCQTCEFFTYQSESNHLFRFCQLQTACTGGEYLANASLTTKGTCLSCSNSSFMSDTSHRLANCSEQPICQDDELLFGASVTAGGTCKKCNDTFCEATIDDLLCEHNEFYGYMDKSCTPLPTCMCPGLFDGSVACAPSSTFFSSQCTNVSVNQAGIYECSEPGMVACKRVDAAWSYEIAFQEAVGNPYMGEGELQIATTETDLNTLVDGIHAMPRDGMNVSYVCQDGVVGDCCIVNAIDTVLLSNEGLLESLSDERKQNVLNLVDDLALSAWKIIFSEFDVLKSILIDSQGERFRNVVLYWGRNEFNGNIYSSLTHVSCADLLLFCRVRMANK